MEVLGANNYAGFWKRLVAFWIDRIILTVPISMLVNQFYETPNYDMFDYHNLLNPSMLVVEVIMLAYFVYFESFNPWQATVGKHLLGLKVVTEDYQKITPQESVIRYLSKYLSAAVFLLGFITIGFNSKKQGWHDKIAKTFVIG